MLPQCVVKICRYYEINCKIKEENYFVSIEREKVQ